jgi:hypothetical protein
MATKKKRRTRTAPLEILNSLPPKGAKSIKPGTIARALASGCGPCEWHNTGASLVAGRITSITQAGFRTCWVYVPVLLSGGRIGYYKVSWSERCGGQRTLKSWW